MDNSPVITSIEEANAPWNEKQEHDGIAIVKCVTTLSKEVAIPIDADVANGVGLSRAYEENHYSIQELLQELKQYIEYDMSMTGRNTGKYRALTRMMDDCQHWEHICTEFDMTGYV